MKDTIVVYYDGECRFCKHYARYVALRKTYVLDLRNAREYPLEMKKFQQQGFDIRQGMIIEYRSKIYHGAEAVLFLEKNRHKKKYTTTIPTKIRQKELYNLANRLRKKILWLSGKTDIL